MVNTNISTDSPSPDRILEAARQVFARDGFLGARMQDIADAAGLNKALLHYYFKNKEQLFERVFQDAFREFMQKLQLIFTGTGSVIEKTEAYLDAHLDLLNRKPDLPLFVINEVNRDPDAFFVALMHNVPQGKSPFQGFMQQIVDEMQEGKIRRMDPRAFWFNVMGMTVFPFLARPMLQRFTETDDGHFGLLMRERAQHLKEFIRLAIEQP